MLAYIYKDDCILGSRLLEKRRCNLRTYHESHGPTTCLYLFYINTYVHNSVSFSERAPNYHNANRTNISKNVSQHMLAAEAGSNIRSGRTNNNVWTIATFGSVQTVPLFVQVPVTRHCGDLYPKPQWSRSLTCISGSNRSSYAGVGSKQGDTFLVQWIYLSEVLTS